MKSFNDLEQYKSAKQRFSLIASVPILLVALCLIGDIFIQSLLTFNAESSTFSHPPTMMLLSSFSSLSLILSSNTKNLQLTSSLGAGIDVLYALVMIIASSKVLKGHNKLYLVTLIAYIVDFIGLIPVTIISALNITLITFNTIDYVLIYVIHAIGVIILVYGLYLQMRLERYEKKELNQNEII